MTATESDTSITTTQPLVFTIPEAAAALRIGRTSVYQLMDTGQLPSIKIGTRRLIARTDLEHFIDQARTR